MAYLLMYSKVKYLFFSAGPGAGAIIIAEIIFILTFDDVFKNMYPSYWLSFPSVSQYGYSQGSIYLKHVIPVFIYLPQGKTIILVI